jgi:hypothetical protein
MAAGIVDVPRDLETVRQSRDGLTKMLSPRRK